MPFSDNFWLVKIGQETRTNVIIGTISGSKKRQETNVVRIEFIKNVVLNIWSSITVIYSEQKNA